MSHIPDPVPGNVQTERMWSKLEFGGEGRVGGVDVEDVSKKETSFKLMSLLKREKKKEQNGGNRVLSWFERQMLFCPNSLIHFLCNFRSLACCPLVLLV